MVFIEHTHIYSVFYSNRRFFISYFSNLDHHSHSSGSVAAFSRVKSFWFSFCSTASHLPPLEHLSLPLTLEARRNLLTSPHTILSTAIQNRANVAAHRETNRPPDWIYIPPTISGLTPVLLFVSFPPLTSYSAPLSRLDSRFCGVSSMFLSECILQFFTK